MINHHPHNRAERLRLKRMKDTFDNKSKRGAVSHKKAELEAKELEDELRITVSGSQAETDCKWQSENISGDKV